MENLLLDDEIEYKTINNIKALCFKIDYPTIKIINQPKIKKWLEFQKKERGNNGFISYCRECNLFFYFIDENEEEETKRKCCSDLYYGRICNYCGEIYFFDSQCCLINGIIENFKFTLFDENYRYKHELYEKLKLIPFLFTFICCLSILFSFFITRRMIINGRIFSCFDEKDNWKKNYSYIIIYILIFLYSLLFMIPYLLLYLFYLFFILIRKCIKKKN